MVQVIKDGLPVRSFEELQSDIDVSTEKLTEVVNIPSRTLARRKKEGKLQQYESERLLRIGLLFERAKEVLGGTEQARTWFKSPKKALGGKTPLDYADTEPGAREVENLLGRIEHGVFS
jgi:putative toxin-antitoxin system antitoxin component (TIGR02293 family)